MSGESLPTADNAVAELLLWVGMRGLVERGDFERRWSAAKLKRQLIDEGLLQLDGEFVFLTAEGDADLTTRLRQLAAGLPGLDTFFADFEALDKEFKLLATDWQQVRPRAEDDPDGLMSVVERWIALDRRFQDAIERSPAAAQLLAEYVPLLQAARGGFEAGDWDRLTGIGENSYHSVWYAVHEVLLRSLGKERTE